MDTDLEALAASTGLTWKVNGLGVSFGIRPSDFGFPSRGRPDFCCDYFLAKSRFTAYKRLVVD
jgi:hypothetical protein